MNFGRWRTKNLPHQTHAKALPFSYLERGPDFLGTVKIGQLSWLEFLQVPLVGCVALNATPPCKVARATPLPDLSFGWPSGWPFFLEFAAALLFLEFATVKHGANPLVRPCRSRASQRVWVGIWSVVGSGLGQRAIQKATKRRGVARVYLQGGVVCMGYRSGTQVQ